MGAALLRWYDVHARRLPWRVGPGDIARGVRPDPYRVWLSEIMLQQTSVAAVAGYFQRFLARWPEVAALAAAADSEVMAEWAGLGYYARARNLLKCARQIAALPGGRFPTTVAELQALPGIGPYTAAAIAAIAFDAPATVVDGNVERVIARLFAVTEPIPASKPRLLALAGRLTPPARPGDHAQAMMDLGATVCTPRAPSCGRCPLRPACRAHSQGIAADLPNRAAKPVKPRRQAIAYVGRRQDGAYLLERRPEKGLLGGTLGWPGSAWREGPAVPDPPSAANWRQAGDEVRHTFTHFHLSVVVMVADLAQACAPERGGFVPAEAFRPETLPTLMRKIYAAAAPALCD
ncbi:MAG: A/G-specific adenine glycosylase [Defluviimonas sp.]|nr:A/G-specific adenine glycosylase [Paracoccaceae bacterium]MCC0063538.1 A/G-specific adenine glycosylase [Defluviimonas sp.]